MNEGSIAFVGVGSNLNDPQAQVSRALDALTRLPESRLAEASKLYHTPPWGEELQPDFVNVVARMQTGLSPEALLEALQGLERDAGRERSGRLWGPRVLDLDLLLYGDLQQSSSHLTLPHPRMHERAFVLLPLLEIAPGVEIPGLGPAAGLLADLDHAGIRPVGEKS